YCAVCWKDAETRYFRREWRFALVVMCSEHAVLLRKDCPNCGKYLFSDSRTGIITTIKYKWLGACVNCEYSFGCKSKQSNNQTNIDHELLDMQLKVINNVRKNEFANLIQDLTLLFGIAWKENELISKYVDLVLKWVNIKYRSIGGNLIIFDIWKFELLKKYDLSKVNLKLRADGIYDLDTCEIKCFVASCNRKYFLNKPNGKSNLTLQLRTHGGLKRIVRDIYKCKRCNIGFGNQYNYQSHYYEIHTTTVDCNKCKEKFPTLSKYQIHLFDKHKKIWNCGRCNLSFDSVSGYHSHYGKEHQKTWNCMKCTINFTSRSKYSSHYQKRHRIKKT
ncbi:MAG: hypothetical protein ACC656_15200, partial [Candidatus Heimdallarchaeota archaeon]